MPRIALKHSKAGCGSDCRAVSEPVGVETVARGLEEVGLVNDQHSTASADGLRNRRQPSSRSTTRRCCAWLRSERPRTLRATAARRTAADRHALDVVPLRVDALLDAPTVC